jgi:excisionase family DNA binding protein
LKRESPVEKSAYLTSPQLATLLGLSRIAVYKKVRRGEIKASKIGRVYAIPKNLVSGILGKTLSDPAKKEIDKAVLKTIKDFGSVLKLLGRE